MQAVETKKQVWQFLNSSKNQQDRFQEQQWDTQR